MDLRYLLTHMPRGGDDFLFFFFSFFAQWEKKKVSDFLVNNVCIFILSAANHNC